MSDLKTSLLINRQVPEFVREEHPKFISFLEAYYEFLEQKQGNKLNDLIKRSKDLRFLSDVDESLDDFESNFFNTFLSLIPKETSVNKEFLIKNALPLYLSKGSEASFKLLFRILFGVESSVTYLKDQILRASDGKWQSEKVLRIDSDIKTYYTGDGVTKEFRLSQEAGFSDIRVFINDNVQNSGYFVKKELQKIIFETAPNLGDLVEVAYRTFATNLLENRKIIGQRSKATAIVEKAGKITLSGQNYYQLFLNDKSYKGNFSNGEVVETNFINFNDEIINVKLQTVSEVNKIVVTEGGSGYNVGDPIIVFGPSTKQAFAVVSNVASGAIEDVNVIGGGHGFQQFNSVIAVGFSNTVFDGFVQSVDARGIDSANTLTVVKDLVSNTVGIFNIIDAGDSAIDIPVVTVLGSNTEQATATVNVKITGVEITNPGTGYESGNTFTVTGGTGESALLTIDTVDGNGNVTSILITDEGIYSEVPIVTNNPFTSNTGTGTGFTANLTFGLHSITVNNPGQNYNAETISVLVSGSNISNTNVSVTLVQDVTIDSVIYGFPNIANVNTSIANAFTFLTLTNLGPITNIGVGFSSLVSTTLPSFDVIPSKVNGSVNILDLGIIANIRIISGGTGYSIGDQILFTNKPNDYTGLGAEAEVVDVAANGAITKILVTNGGLGYSANKLPDVSVISTGGSNAAIVVDSLMGNGESLIGVLPLDEEGNQISPGKVYEIKILFPGVGYTQIPSIDMSQRGNGNARAEAEILGSIETLKGKWLTTDSMLSSEDRKLQGRDYYINYAYLLSAKVEFSKYKEIFKTLIHPAGTIQYSEYMSENLLEKTTVSKIENLDVEIVPSEEEI
jgi:hypothetical protein